MNHSPHTSPSAQRHSLRSLFAPLNLLGAFVLAAGLAGRTEAATATIRLHADNSFVLFRSSDDSVTGDQIAARISGEGDPPGLGVTVLGQHYDPNGYYWGESRSESITLIPGQINYLHIAVVDQGGIGGFLADVSLSDGTFKFADGSSFTATGSGNWRASVSGFGNYGAPIDLGGNGVAPWGLQSDLSSDARWIWAGDGDATDFVYLSVAIIPQPSIVSLGDIVGGGDGSGNGTYNTGISARDGATAGTTWFGAGNDGGTPFNTPVAGNPRINGVFVPRQDAAATQISTTGLSYAFPGTDGGSWDAIRNGVSTLENNQDVNPIYDTTGAITTVGVGMHANSGITFDLLQIGAAYPGARATSFTGNVGGKPNPIRCGTGDAIAHVLIDGILVYSKRVGNTPDSNTLFNIAIPGGARFLTLAVTDGGNGGGCDKAYFANALVQFTFNPVITWANPAPITYGTPLGAVQLNATASVPGSFAYTPAAGTVLPAGTHVLTVAFTPADATLYSNASGQVTLAVQKAPATVTLGTLSHTYDGSAKSASATTAPAGLPVSFTYNGSGTQPTAAGSYAVVGEVNDANYTGSASGTLMIVKAVAAVTLGRLSHTSDGTPKPASAITVPSGLNVTFTYDGSATPPSAAGTYAVVAMVVNENNYTGSASGTLTITATSDSPPVVIGADGSVSGSGPLNLEGGTLLATASATVTKPVVLGPSGGTIDTGVHNLTVQGVVSGPGQLVKQGTGTLTLNANNTYSGGTLVNGGIIKINRNSNLGALAARVKLTKAQLRVQAQTAQTRQTIPLARKIQVYRQGGRLTTFGGRSTTQVTKSIRGSGTVRKSGKGTLQLSGNQKYRGKTAVKRGTLKVNRPSKISKSRITVTQQRQRDAAREAQLKQQLTPLSKQPKTPQRQSQISALLRQREASKAKLRGTGRVKSATFKKNSALAAGNSPGSLSVDENVQLEAGSIIEWEINNAAGVKGAFGGGWDWLDIGGTLDISASAADPVVLDVRSLLVEEGAVEEVDPEIEEEAEDPDADLLELEEPIDDAEEDEGEEPDDAEEEEDDEFVPYGELLNFDPRQNYRWVVATAQGGINGFSADEFQLDLTAFQSDLEGGSFSVEADTNNVYLVFTRFNHAPVASSQNVTGPEDTAIPVTLSAADEDIGDAVSLSIVTGPAYGTLSGTPPQLTYTPALNFHGSDSFTFKANDGKFDSEVATVSLSITPVNDAPVVAIPIPSQTGLYGSAFHLIVPAETFTDVDVGQSLSYGAAGLPPGLALNPSTRTLSGVALAAGTFPSSATATDDGSPSLSATAPFAFTVNKAPLSVTAADASRNYGEANPPLTGTLIGVVNNDNITATYSTAATADSPVGTCPIVPSLFDLDGKLVHYAVSVNHGTFTVKNVPPVVSAGPDQEKVALDEVTFAGSFIDPSSPSHVVGWDFGDGSPAVIGTLTPTHAYAKHGVYTVTLTVTDSHLASASDTLTVTVISSLGCATEARDGLVPFVKESKRIEKAVKDLTASLEPKLWLDEVHLHSKLGEKAFTYWRQATDMMEQLLKPSLKRERDDDDDEDDEEFKKLFGDQKSDKLSAEAVQAIQQALADVICASRLISETLYLENQGLIALDPKRQKQVDAELARAKDDLDQANALAEKGDSGTAVRRYVSSWKKTQEAIEIAMKQPGSGDDDRDEDIDDDGDEDREDDRDDVKSKKESAKPKGKG